MTKIIQVLNAMISQSELITNVIKCDKEYFFLYNKKYKWSIALDDREIYFVHFYPSNEVSLEELSNRFDWTGFDDFVTYKSSDFKTVEADETFRELYQIVSNKLYNLDEIFNDIINNS
ncbi:hypothetical protein [uncultured Chryseobacterium sp.]|uniref:hypothetical protein n=1 Tax=uncultured Chryseobacterium sp. TaxID=259322 RepID=UPI0025DBD3D6|nr:hypothetical protein [uncultured Chryseobacterium sp.]